MIFHLLLEYIQTTRPELWAEIEHLGTDEIRQVLNRRTGCNVQTQDSVSLGSLTHLRRLRDINLNLVD